MPLFDMTCELKEFNQAFQPIISSDSLCLPRIHEPISAGVPLPGGSFLHSTFNLNEALITSPTATFLMRVYGDLLVDCGINSEDLIIVDRSALLVDGSVIFAVLEGVLTVKRFHKSGGTIQLVSENSSTPPIVVTKEMDFYLLGVVTHVIHNLLVK